MGHFKQKLLTTVTGVLMLSMPAWAQEGEDVTNKYIPDGTFESCTAIDGNVFGYKSDYDKEKKGYLHMQPIPGWELTNSADGAGSAVFSYGSGYLLSGNKVAPPVSGPDGETDGKAVGMFAVWTNTVQYKTSSDCTLPAGKYTMTFDVYRASGTDKPTSSKFGFISSSGDNYCSTPSLYTKNGWQKESFSFTLSSETTGNFSIGFASVNKGSGANAHFFIDNIKIYYLDPLAEAKSNLTAVIDNATAIAGSKVNVGTAPFQRTEASVAALSEAVTAALSALDAGDATKESLNSAQTTLEAAIAAYKEAALVAPAAGQLFNIINISEGYGPQGNAVTFRSAADADLSQNTTKMGYNVAPGSYLPQAVTFTAVEGEPNMYHLSYTRADGNVVYVATGVTSGLGNSTAQIRPTTDPAKALKVKVVATDVAGVWNLYNTEANTNIGANGVTDQGFFTVANFNSMSLVEAKKNEVTLTIEAANPYATLVLPFDAALPEGLKAYTVAEVNAGKSYLLTLDEATELKANTPYVVYAENGMTHTFSGYGNAYTDANGNDVAQTNGLLSGVYTETAAPTGTFVFDAAKRAFFAATAETKVAPNAAYLTVADATETAYFLNDEDYLEGYKLVYEEALAAAQIVQADQDYKNVSGKEKTDLDKALADYATCDASVEAYSTATTTLNSAREAFVAAKTNYDLLVVENAKAEALGVDAVVPDNEFTAADAEAKVKELKVAEYNKVKADYTASVELGEWTKAGPAVTRTGQHWDEASSYWDSDAWDNANWTITMNQTLNLTKGSYVFKMTGRHSAKSNMSLIVKNAMTSETIGSVSDFPVGDKGLGVNKAGDASFDAADSAGFANNGSGRGWEWRYVPFTLTEDAEVEFRIEAGAAQTSQWLSFCNYSVETTPLTAAYVRLKEAKEAGNTALAAEEYANVAGKEKADLQAAVVADAGAEEGTINAAVDAINSAIETFKAAAPSWNRYAVAKETAGMVSLSYTDMKDDNTKTADDVLAEANRLFAASLDEAAKDMSDKTFGFGQGEYAPYNHGTCYDIKNLQGEDGKVASEAIADRDAEGLKSMVEKAFGMTWTANETEVNAIYDGTLAKQEAQRPAQGTNVVLPGWTTVSGATRHIYKGMEGADGKACLNTADGQTGVFVYPGEYEYGSKEGYKMPLKAGKWYVAKAKYCSWSQGENKDFSLTIKKDGATVRTKNFGSNAKPSSEAGALKAVEHLFCPETAGDYVFSIYVSGNTFMTDFYVVSPTPEDVTISEEVTYTPTEKFANVTLTRTFVEGWNGCVLPFDMSVEEVKTKFGASQVKAFSAVENSGNGVTLNFEDAAEVKAGVPFMLKVDADPASNKYSIDNVYLPTTALKTVEKSTADGLVTYAFKATYATQDITGPFTLIQGKYFWNYGETETANAKAFRGYFANTSTSAEGQKMSVGAFSLGDETTAISEIRTDAAMRNDGQMRDLQGRFVKTASKGVYLLNGKKYVVK